MKRIKRAVGFILFVTIAICAFSALADSEWVCSQCGRENGGDIVFCPKCGQLRQDRVQCPSCGKIYSVYDEYGFCPSCGSKLPEVVIEGPDKAISMVQNGKYAEADEYLSGLEASDEVYALRKEAFYESRILWCAYRTKDNLLFPETMRLLEAICYNGGETEYDDENQTPMIYYNQPAVLIHYQAQNKGGTISEGYQRFTWDREKNDYIQHKSVDTLETDSTEPYWLKSASVDEQLEYYDGQMEISLINLEISRLNLVGGWEMSCDDEQLDKLNIILQKVKSKNITIPYNNEFVPDPIINEAVVIERNRIASIYSEARSLEEQGLYSEAIEIYVSISDYQDSLERIDVCKEGIKEQIYQEARAMEEQGLLSEAIEKYVSISDYQDCLERINACKEIIKERAEQEAQDLAASQKVYAGATPVPIYPNEMPTPTPLPKVEFTYMEYSIPAWGISFEGPATWIVIQSNADEYILVNPDPSIDYQAKIEIKRMYLNKNYTQKELIAEVKQQAASIQAAGNYKTFDCSKTAARFFIDGNGVYLAYKGYLDNGVETGVAGRIIVNTVDKTLYVLHVSYPRGLADVFADGVYNKVRHSMKIN